MSRIKGLMVILLSVLRSAVCGDVEVSCVFMESCILPCSLQVNGEVIIHWIQLKAGQTPVLFYYSNQDQLAHQDQRFKNRTSLFKDQISRGNASLRLTAVELQDQSRYRCSTSTTGGHKDSYINLRVDAPVGEVSIQQVENRITCSSEGIYPEPELSWSTNPPSNQTLQTKTRVQQTKQQLYNISSSLIVSETNVDYSCTVSTRRNKMTATLFKPNVEVSCVFMESCILPCSLQVNGEVIIHWIQLKAGQTPVLSYYSNQDQLANQNQRFKNRTSLFKDQISRGNASLRLTAVELQDQSRYRCSTSTTGANKDSFINLRVDAPVCEVSIQQVENRITCSSEGIYPEPELSWSTNPPSNQTLQTKTRVQQTKQQLYNISSSLIVSETNVDYSCTVSTRRNKMTATLFKPNRSNVPAIVCGVIGPILGIAVLGGMVYFNYNNRQQNEII